MNYAGHEKLRAEVAEVANAMCDLRTTILTSKGYSRRHKAGGEFGRA